MARSVEMSTRFSAATSLAAARPSPAAASAAARASSALLTGTQGSALTSSRVQVLGGMEPG